MSETVQWSSMQDAPGAEQARQQLLREMAVKSYENGGLTPEDAAALMADAEAEEPRTWEPPRVLDPTNAWSQEEIEYRHMNPGEGVGAYASALILPEKPALSSEEAIAELFTKMKPYKKFLVAIMNACREEADAAIIDAAVEPEYEFCSCVYTPIALRKMLTEAGAIEYLMSEEEFRESLKAFELPVEAAGESAEGEGVAEGEVPDEGEIAADAEGVAAPEAAEEPAAEEAAEAEAEAEAEPEPEAAEEDAEGEDPGLISIYDQPGYLVIEEDAPGTWMITEAGLAYLDAIDPERQFNEALGVHASVADVFYDIIAYCAEEPRNIAEIVTHFADDSRLGPETFYASYVVDRLEEIGALTWKKNWVPTELGLKLLAERPEVL